LVVAQATAGCGARSTLDADVDVEAHGVRGCPSSPAPPGSSSCGDLSLHMQTQASCALGLADGASLDGEGFIQAHVCKTFPGGPVCREPGPRDCHRVLAMNRFQAGHVMGWCDGTTLGALVGGMDAFAYLGATDAPRVASVGHVYPCPPPLQGLPGV